jgi:hypothetical protein
MWYLLISRKSGFNYSANNHVVTVILKRKVSLKTGNEPVPETYFNTYDGKIQKVCEFRLRILPAQRISYDYHNKRHQPTDLYVCLTSRMNWSFI